MDTTIFRRMMGDLMTVEDILENTQRLCAKGFHPQSVDLIQKVRFQIYEIVVNLHATRTHTPPQ